MRRIVALFLFSLATLSCFAQQDKVGNWLMYFGQNKVSEKLSIHTEIQYRNHTIAPVNVEQLLLRTGLNYHIKDGGMITAGYAYIPSFIYDSDQKIPESEEHRVWQQFISVNTIDRVKLEHRYRAEQRWVNGEYKNRLRYRLMLFIPLNNDKMTSETWFVGAYNELFVNGSKNYFDRNRLYGALGYQFDPQSSLQIGMLNQKVYNTDKWYVQFAYVFNPKFY